MTTTTDAAARIGTQAQIQVGDPRTGRLTITVTVLDYKSSYGRDRWLVTPVEGTGEVWAESLYWPLDRPPRPITRMIYPFETDQRERLG
jgi:hypothetical protein